MSSASISTQGYLLSPPLGRTHSLRNFFLPSGPSSPATYNATSPLPMLDPNSTPKGSLHLSNARVKPDKVAGLDQGWRCKVQEPGIIPGPVTIANIIEFLVT